MAWNSGPWSVRHQVFERHPQAFGDPFQRFKAQAALAVEEVVEVGEAVLNLRAKPFGGQLFCIRPTNPPCLKFENS
jgi:hypothetical protein